MIKNFTKKHVFLVMEEDENHNHSDAVWKKYITFNLRRCE